MTRHSGVSSKTANTIAADAELIAWWHRKTVADLATFDAQDEAAPWGGVRSRAEARAELAALAAD